MTRTAALAVSVIAGFAAPCTGGTGAPDERNVVEVFGPWRGTDADRFAEVLAPADLSGMDSAGNLETAPAASAVAPFLI